MSKKLASGADKLVLDVKMGSGAFVKDLDGAKKLAEMMVRIGEMNGRETVAVITNMNRPLGKRVGNLLEVQEAEQTLQGRGPEDLTEVCLCLAAQMLSLAGKGSYQACYEMAEATLKNGAAQAAFQSFIQAQGGAYDVIAHPERYYEKPAERTIHAKQSGYLQILSAEEIGRASMMLGAGRETKDSRLDYTAGIVFHKNIGDAVDHGEALCTLYAQDSSRFQEAAAVLAGTVTVTGRQLKPEPLIFIKMEGHPSCVGMR